MNWLRVFAACRSDYVIFYLPLHDGIDVVRVLHSARDIEAIFEMDQPE